MFIQPDGDMANILTFPELVEDLALFCGKGFKDSFDNNFQDILLR